MKTTWDFVEEYYPNYHSCNMIAESDDLIKIMDGEYEEGDSAHRRLVEDYSGDENDPQIAKDYDKVMRFIYEESIINYINSQNK